MKYPLLADTRRAVSRAFNVLNDDPSWANDQKRIGAYLRSKRAWFIIDKSGIIRYAQITDPRGLVPTEELLEIVEKYK